MADRPYLTSAEAATYCGFKTIGGIQQAVRRGKLKPAGRRGGTGTYVFAKEDLDAFLTGGLQPHERLFVPPELNEAARLVAARPPAAPSRARARPPRPRSHRAGPRS
ncbi:MAG TPA: helix-turn-helix domain-containing protein, partial [Pseudomonadota bacterium]|nr:helix-turn-helix domain-containing protein [Pseudomonadota bacterium]